MSVPPKSDARPLSPHLQVWRWHVTMASSILHRATGGALYAGAVGLAGWLFLAAYYPDLFAVAQGVLASPIGVLALFGIAVSLFYHLANGIRHLIWDMGHGLEPKAANASAWFVILAGLAGGVALTVLAFAKGG